MKKKTHKIKKHYKPLPPHTWEAHTTASHGEVNKQLIIAIITIVSIVVLAGLLFFTDVFVGKAITFVEPTTVGQAGIFVSGSPEPDEWFEIPVKVNFPDNENSVAVDLLITFDPKLDVDCTEDKIFAPLDKVSNQQYAVKKLKCDPSKGQIQIEAAWLCEDEECSNSLSGVATVANLLFKGEAGSYVIDVQKVDALSLDSNVDLATLETGQTKIIIQLEIPDPSCGDGTLDPAELCDDGNSVNGDGCDNICNIEIGWDCTTTGCSEICIDTDGGHIFDVKGLLHYGTDTTEDYCDATTGLLVEHVCDNGLLATVEQLCEGGCEDGRCLEVTLPVCSTTNLEACKTAANCEAYGGVWDGSGCIEDIDTQYIECDTAEDCPSIIINAVCIDNLNKGYTFCVADSDGDGVLDNRPDICPSTPEGVAVDVTGCALSTCTTTN